MSPDKVSPIFPAVHPTRGVRGLADGVDGARHELTEGRHPSGRVATHFRPTFPVFQ